MHLNANAHLNTPECWPPKVKTLMKIRDNLFHLFSILSWPSKAECFKFFGYSWGGAGGGGEDITVVATPVWTKHSLCSKLIHFKMVWQTFKVFFHPSPSKSYQKHIGALKWGTMCSWTYGGCKVTGHQSLNSIKTLYLHRKQRYSNFDDL